MQLSLFPSPRPDGHPTLTDMASIELRPAVFYYCLRELDAGRAWPVKVTDAQRHYIERWL